MQETPIKMKVIICLLLAFYTSHSFQFDEDTEEDLDYNLENLLSRRSLGDPYFDSLLEKYRQARNSVDDNRVDVPYGKDESLSMNINMPGITPVKHDSYFCISKAMPADLNAFIVGYKPIAEMHTAHHMLLFGCEKPLREEGKIWPCGEMQGVCGSGGQRIMYAWGRNAPRLKLPKDVGFQVGKDSSVKYLTLQVHYGKVDQFKNGKKDYSGVNLDLTKRNLLKRGGIYLLADGWSNIPPHEKKWHIDAGCYYGDRPILRTFAFRVHAHKLGVVVSGYRIRDKKWTLIGKGDPQRPQAFYPSQDVDIRPGDRLVARCTYNSMSRDHVTRIGATMEDEMCNFYIMYYYHAEGNPYPPGQSCSMGEILPHASYFNGFPQDSDTPLPGPKIVEKRGAVPEKDVVKAKRPVRVFHEEVKNWPVEKLEVGQVAGVALDERRNKVVIFHRGSNKWGYGTFTADKRLTPSMQKIIVNTVLYLDPTTGEEDKKLSWGGNMFYLPHGLTIDHNGYVWLTDVGAHQVFKFDGENMKPLMVLGKAMVPGNDKEHFCKPTDVAVDRSGMFYVSDGYCNQRIMVFMENGKLSKIIKPQDPAISAPHSFNIPHSLALDEDARTLFVADRENNRVLIYNIISLKFIGALTHDFHGPVFAVTVRDGVLHAVTGFTKEADPIGLCISEKSGRVFSAWQPSGGFGQPHDLVSSKGNREIYVVEIGPNRVRKFIRKERRG